MKNPQAILTIILSVIGSFLLLGCSKNRNTDQTNGGIIPLAIGNSWIYLGTAYDTSGLIQDNFKGKHEINGDTILFGRICFVHDGNDFYADTDSGLIIYGGYSCSSEEPKDTIPSFNLLYKYPARLGDKSFDGDVKVVAIDTLIKVPAGEFRCIKYEWYRPGFHEADFYVSPGIGLVKSIRYYRNYYPANPLHVRERIELSSFIQPTMYDSTYVSFDSLKNALIYDEDFGWVRLKNSEYSIQDSDSQGGYVHLVDEFTFIDLNKDGYKDILGTLSTNTGGSGSFASLVVFLNKSGTPVYTDSYFIGDREGIDSITTVEDTLHVYFRMHGKDDAMCCPTLRVEKRFKFNKNKLNEIM